MSTPISTSMSTLPSRSSSGTYLTLPSPRAAMISELAQQNQQITRQRKVAIPLIHSRALSASNMVRSKGFFLGRSNGYLFFSLHFTITQQILATQNSSRCAEIDFQCLVGCLSKLYPFFIPLSFLVQNEKKGFGLTRYLFYFNKKYAIKDGRAQWSEGSQNPFGHTLRLIQLGTF